MISRPRRSVTRFFVPLIDVLILLFCIFLLMPFVHEPDEENTQLPTEDAIIEAFMPRSEQEAKEENEMLRNRVAQLTDDLNALRRRQQSLGDQIQVELLYIDDSDGELYHFAPERREIRNQAEAQRLIDQTRRIAGLKEPFFLILYPRKLSGFPTARQVETYERWFANVEHGFDNPFSAG